MPGLADFIGGPTFGAIGGLLGGLFGNSQIQSGISDIQGLAQFNPQNAGVQGLGSFGFGPGGGGFQMDQGLQNVQGGLGGMLGQLFQGGTAGQLSGALGNQGGIGGAVDQSNSALQQQANPFFNQANFANNQANMSGLGNMFAGNVAQGPQDQSGGAMQGLFGQGFQNLQSAGNVGGLIQQNLDASNALAQPGEQLATNRFLDREFTLTGGATSGSGQRGGEFLQAQLAAQNQRVMNAQQLGLQQSQQMGQLGLGQTGQGAGLLGQNLGFFNQQANQAGQFGQLANQGEAQGFQQMLQSLQGNQSAGTQRLQNMLGLFNAQTGAAQGAQQLGIQGAGQFADIGNLGLEGILGLLNAEANRVGATGLHAQAIGQASSNSGGLLGGLF